MNPVIDMRSRSGEFPTASVVTISATDCGGIVLGLLFAEGLLEVFVSRESAERLLHGIPVCFDLMSGQNN